ncbi:MAG TPA: site-2 protease family protein [Planctomycetota bacterium]|nr:site-2 protease family protein [Planctomycetota bacterium]
MLPADIPGWTGLVVIMLLSLSFHEAAHAFVADRLGDPTARRLGRVTLNPLKHLDPFLSFLLPAVLAWLGAPVFGGGKPVPINVLNFRHKARDFMLVALAGPFSNLALAALFAALFVASAWTGVLPPVVVRNPYGPDQLFYPMFSSMASSGHAGDFAAYLELWLKLGVLLNLGLALFNLLPLPPLDGSRVIGWLLPRPLQFRWYALDRLGILLVFGLLYFGGLEYVGYGLEWSYNTVGSTIDAIVGVGPT